jgi:hypothetical protein
MAVARARCALAGKVQWPPVSELTAPDAVFAVVLTALPAAEPALLTALPADGLDAEIPEATDPAAPLTVDPTC